MPRGDPAAHTEERRQTRAATLLSWPARHTRHGRKVFLTRPAARKLRDKSRFSRATILTRVFCSVAHQTYFGTAAKTPRGTCTCPQSIRVEPGGLAVVPVTLNPCSSQLEAGSSLPPAGLTPNSLQGVHPLLPREARATGSTEQPWETVSDDRAASLVPGGQTSPHTPLAPVTATSPSKCFT